MAAIIDTSWLSMDATNWVTIVIDASAKGTLVLAGAGLLTLALRRASATARHLVWSLALAGLIALPILSIALPAWHLPVLPRVSPPAQPSLESALKEAPPAEVIPEHVLTQQAGFAETAPPFEHPAGPIAAERSGISEFEPQRMEMASSTLRPHWSMTVFVVWLAGVVVVSGFLLLGTVLVWRVARTARPVGEDSPWAMQLQGIGENGNGRFRVRMLESERVAVPMMWGLLRPLVLLPAPVQEWSEERRRIVLLHELAHLARGDCLTQTMAQLACALYWFNPLVWLAGRRMRVERERACDDRVLSAGLKASDYANHLLEIARSARALGCAAIAAVAMARPSHMEGRLLAILDAKRSRRALTRAAFAVAFLAAACIVAPLAAMRLATATSTAAQERPPAVSPATRRDRPQAEKSRGNMHEIGLACLMYAKDHDGEWPERLEPLVKRGYIYDPRVLRNPARPELEVGYIYVRPPKGAASGTIVLYEAFDAWPEGGVLVLRLDNAVLSVTDEAEFKTRLGRAPPTELQAGLWVAALPNGVTVELVGVSYSPADIQPVWKPNGSPLAATPWDRVPASGRDQRKDPEHYDCFDFVVRVAGLPEDADTKWALIPPTLPYGGGWPTKDQVPLKEFKVRTACLPKSLASATLRFGVAGGDWETFASFEHMGVHGNQRHGILSRFGPVPFLGYGPRTQMLVVTHAMSDRATRVVAVDGSGNVHRSSESGTWGKADVWNVVGHFPDLERDDIKEFRFQIRPYEWVEFRNVSLSPGQKTDAQVTVEAPEAAPHVPVLDKIPILKRLFESEGTAGRPALAVPPPPGYLPLRRVVERLLREEEAIDLESGQVLKPAGPLRTPDFVRWASGQADLALLKGASPAIAFMRTTSALLENAQWDDPRFAALALDLADRQQRFQNVRTPQFVQELDRLRELLGEKRSRMHAMEKQARISQEVQKEKKQLLEALKPRVELGLAPRSELMQAGTEFRSAAAELEHAETELVALQPEVVRLRRLINDAESVMAGTAAYRQLARLTGLRVEVRLLPAKDELPVTYGVLTGEGSIGLLQVVEAGPNQVKIRYKIVQHGEARAPAGVGIPGRAAARAARPLPGSDALP